MSGILKKFKGFWLYSVILGLMSTVILFPTSTTFASASSSSSSVIVPDHIIYLSDEEYKDLITSFEEENNESQISIQGIKPAQEKTDWGSLLSRSTFTGKSSGGIKQYTNRGNEASAHIEFGKIGGGGEVTQYVNGTKVTYVKKTPSGDVRLYRSSSETDGNNRPTISFLKDKVRFLGD